jgi:hypothetical protein
MRRKRWRGRKRRRMMMNVTAVSTIHAYMMAFTML